MIGFQSAERTNSAGTDGVTEPNLLAEKEKIDAYEAT
jgi:hypothetical protein